MIWWWQTYSSQKHLWTCLLGIEPFLSQETTGVLVARIGFACGYGGVVESFSCSTWLSCDSHYCGGQKHMWVQKWMEPGSLNGCSDGTEAVLGTTIFERACWSQDTRAALRIFLELSDFIHSSPTLFLVTIESHCWAVTALGGYSSGLLPVAWHKHFMLKLGWTCPHTYSYH